MTITAVGPDGTQFNFPDETDPGVVSSTIRKHYGTDQPAAAPPTTVGRVAEQLARGVPILGPAVTGHIGSQQDREAWEAAHPWLSTGLQTAGGAAALALAPEAEGLAFGTKLLPKALGMTGRLAPAAIRGGTSGAAIGAADALARGEDPRTGAAIGGLTGAGGVLAGKAAGRVWDAARGMWAPAAEQRYLPYDVAGGKIPASEAQIATAEGRPDPNLTREEEYYRKTGDPTAMATDTAANAAMRQAHDTLTAQLDPTGQSPGTQPLTAGENAAADLVRQEQARAALQVQRMAGVEAQGTQLRQDLGGGVVRPVSDVGEAVSTGVGSLFQRARAGVNALYQTLRNVPGEFNPRYLLNMGENAIRPALNDPTRVGLPRSERVYVKPDLMPQTAGALQDIDHEIGQLALTNEAARGNRPITSEDIEEVRKVLVQRQQAANAAARAGVPNGWQDARGMQRVIQEFDRHMLDVVTAPRGFTGDAQAYIDAQQAARQSHANMRAVFSRQGPGDKVGQFMENVIGKYPGQEMSPEKIVSSLMGTPDRPAPENAVPILTRLRDRVFGANSPEWQAIKQGVVEHLTGTLPGADPVPVERQVQRIERFLGNERHSGAILNAGERARLQTHANNLRAAGALGAEPARGSIDDVIASLGGRYGVMGTGGQKLMTQLLGTGGEQLAAELRQRLPASTYNQLRQGVFQRIAEAPEGMMPWEHQKTGQKIAAFLNTPQAQALFSPNERAVMGEISRAHLDLVPTKGGTNPSGTSYAGESIIKKWTGQLFKMIATSVGLAHGGPLGALHGFTGAAAASKAAEAYATRRAAARAQELFVGRRPTLAPSTGAQRAFAQAGQLPALRDQSSQ